MDAGGHGKTMTVPSNVGAPLRGIPGASLDECFGADENLDRELPAADPAPAVPDAEWGDLLGIAFDCFPAGAIIVGLDGRVLHVNPAFCELLGRPARELERQRLADIVAADQRASLHELTESLLRGARDHSRDKQTFACSDGSPIVLDMTTAVLKTAAGKPRALLALTNAASLPSHRHVDAAERPVDATDRQVDAPDRQADLEVDIETLRNEFEMLCRTVSREFRIPLRIIEGYAGIVVEDCSDRLDAVARRHLHTILDQSRRLSTMIDNTLSLAKILNLPLRREAIDLSALALDAAAVVRAESHAHEVEIRVQGDLFAYADPGLASQLLRRLFENAFRFVRDSASPLVEFGWITDTRAFFVRDNGSGLDREVADNLFLPFETLHESTDASDSVGLAQVQRIVTRHGGRVWAQGAAGRGASIYFTLPAVAAGPVPSSKP